MLKSLFYVLLSLLAILPETVIARCDNSRGTAEGQVIILHINGINTSESEACDAKTKLSDVLAEAGVTNFHAYYIYNPSGSWLTGSLTYPKDDLAELTLQARISLYAKSNANLDQTSGGVTFKERYYYQLGKLYTDGLAGKYMPGTNPIAAGGDIDVYDISKKTADYIEAFVLAGKKVILVPHSQGNFVAEAAVSLLVYGGKRSSVLSSVHVVGVAPVAATTPNDRYMLAFQDIAVKAALLGSLDQDGVVGYFSLDSNIRLCSTWDGSEIPIHTYPGNPYTWPLSYWNNHGFLNTYISNDVLDCDSKKTMRDVLIAKIRDAFDSLNVVTAGRFTKVANNGKDIPSSAAAGYKPTDWACTRDNLTNLLWEVKSGSSADATYTYLTSVAEIQVAEGSSYRFPTEYEVEWWGNSKPNINYTNDVLALCGQSNWRIPSYGEFDPYFPSEFFGSLSGTYWTSNLGYPCPFGGCYTPGSAFAWVVHVPFVPAYWGFDYAPRNSKQKMIFVSSQGTSSVPAIRWSAAGDFKLTNNPNSAWGYGYQMGAGKIMSMGATSQNCSDLGMDCWKMNALAPDIPMVAINRSGISIAKRTVIVPNGVLVLHPGLNGERAIVTWTAPESGTYALNGAFQIVDVNPSGVIVSVAVDGISVTSASIGRSVTQQAINFTRVLSKGQVLSFSVDSDGNYGNDSTALTVTITKSAPPAVTSCNSPVKSLAFSEDFATSLDSAKWSVSENGGTVRSGGGSITLSTVGSRDQFPVVSTNSDVIPAVGNFSLFCRAKYDPTNPYGAGACVATTRIVEAGFPGLYGGYIGVWGGANSVYTWGFDADRQQLYSAVLAASKTDFHDYETCVINGEVTAYIDGALVARAAVSADKLRPKRIWLGHPGNTAAPNNWVTVETAKIEVRQLQ